MKDFPFTADLTVDCGGDSLSSDCGGCGGREECGGECHWQPQASLCVHAAVHSAPPFLSLSYSGLAAERIPGAMGVYSLSHTTRDSHHLVGYSLLRDRTGQNNDTELLYFFKDYSDPTSEFLSKVPFSRAGKDLVLLHNESSWFLNVPRHNGESELVRNPAVSLLAMQSREDHGQSVNQSRFIGDLVPAQTAS